MTRVEDLKPLASKAIDLSQYEGRRVRIESVEVVRLPSKYSATEDGETDVLRVQTVPLRTIQDREGNDAKLRASELFNLNRDTDGTLGWPTGPKSKLAGFLRLTDSSAPSELPEKEVTVRVRRRRGTDGESREFLGFDTA